MRIFACLAVLAMLVVGCEPVKKPDTTNMSAEAATLALARYYAELRLDGSGVTIAEMTLNPHNPNQVIAKLSNKHSMTLNLHRNREGKVTEVSRTDYTTGAPVRTNPFELKNRTVSTAIPCDSPAQMRQISADAGAFIKAHTDTIKVYDVISGVYTDHPITPAPEMLTAKFSSDTPQALFYAAEVDIAEAGKYAVAIYFDGDIELFVNGSRALSAQSKERVRQVHLLPLEKGRNRIVVRGVADGEWAFSIKVVDGPVIVK